MPTGQLPEAAGEGNLFVRAEGLVAEEQHLVLKQRRPDGGDTGVVDVGEVGTFYLGADNGGKWAYGQGGKRTWTAVGNGHFCFSLVMRLRPFSSRRLDGSQSYLSTR